MTKKKILKTVLIVFLIINVFVAIISFGLFGSFNIYRVIGGMISVSNNTEKIVKVSIVPKVYMIHNSYYEVEAFKKAGFREVYYGDHNNKLVYDGKVYLYTWEEFGDYRLLKLSYMTDKVEYVERSTLNDAKFFSDVEVKIVTEDIKNNTSDIEFTIKNNTDGSLANAWVWYVDYYCDGEWKKLGNYMHPAVSLPELPMGEEKTESFELDWVAELKKGKYRLIILSDKTTDGIYYIPHYGVCEFEIE